MGIKRIVHLDNCRVFRDFTWPESLNEFARFNLIYGWNGSGKTTISRILRDLELRRTPEIGKVHLLTDNEHIHETDFSSTSIPIRVFNKEFVAENVFPISGEGISPIFVLGEKNIIKQKKLDDYKSKFTKIRESHQKAEEKKMLNSELFDKHCIDNAKNIKKQLRGPGDDPFANYNKNNYNDRAQKMLADGDANSYRFTDAKHNRLTDQLRALQEDPIDKHTYQEPDFVSLRDKVASLLSVTVISKIIQSLRDDTSTSEWVYDGLDLHKNPNAADCLFCGQSLPEQRIYELEQHFNTTYNDTINSLDELAKEIKHSLESVSILKIPDGAMFYKQLAGEYGVIQNELEHYCDRACTYLRCLADQVSNKKKHIFEHVPMDNDRLQLPDSSVLDRLKEIIARHNQLCEEHTASIEKARHMLADGYVADELDEFKRLQTSVEECDAEIKPIKGRMDDLSAKISSLETETTQHGPPAIDLNDDLRQYLGHKELQLKVQDNGYTITRNDILASQLSEGETTAIALLYFLRSLKDRRFDFKNGIVVLDDPVSSLDANALFLAHGFIQSHAENAGQLFILTHNFTFFRQVRGWFRHIPGQRKTDIQLRPSRFYMLNCLSDDGGRHSAIQTLDPLLEYYESDYHYLFACVQRSVSLSKSTLETNYVLPNMARRLLEAFLSFRQPDVSGGLRIKMQGIDFDKAKKLRILRFINAYSHNNAIMEPEHDPSLLSEAPAVLSNLLELIQTVDLDHYDRMVNLVKQKDKSEI